MGIIISLVNHMAVLMVIAYILTRTRFYSKIVNKEFSLKNRVLLIAIFGSFSIYGTLSGIRIRDAICNIRDLGPALGGLIAGPVVGLGAGLIGSLHRYLMGGSTALPCSLATLSIGLAGGLIYIIKKGKLIGIPGAVTFGICVEIFHMGLVLLIGRPFPVMLDIVKKITLPMISANAIGLGVFIFITSNLVKERETIAIKERIQSELNIGHEIQMSLIPKIFPPFPNRKDFEIFALIEPAREVGGDFYDFYFLDEEHLCFLIGDVSGKGVPASLYMAVTKTLIKMTASQSLNPGDILTKVNNELSKDNDSTMFVTLFCSVLNTVTGKLLYANGGHNQPLLIQKDGGVTFLKRTGDPVVGILEDLHYKSERLALASGDVLFVYTDGVTEAMNGKAELYSNERLKRDMETIHSYKSTRDIIKAIMKSVKAFSAGVPQTDDIAMMGIKFFGV
jgi:sigma-B regulation protein RsbU (phosphoserine phosphatase)